METRSRYLAITAGLGALAVACGAFGAHGLAERLGPERLAIYDTGTRYLMYHTIALLALLAGPAGTGVRAWGAWCARFWILGALLFSGSLYALALTEIRALGAVTPIGGAALLAGWLCLAISAWTTPAEPR